MPGGSFWAELSTWLHLAVLIAGTVVYSTGLFWIPSGAYFVPFGAMLVVFPLLFALSLALGLLAWRALGQAGVNKLLAQGVGALRGLMLCLSAAFSVLWFGVANGDWWRSF